MEKLLKAVDGKTDNESRSLKKLIITAIINDKDVVDAYKDVHPDLINEDIHKGNLARYPTVTDVRLE